MICRRSPWPSTPPDQQDGPLSRQEFISGTPAQVAEEIITQCYRQTVEFAG